MYTVDQRDTVVARTDVPAHSAGSPCPLVLAGDHFLSLAYYLSDAPEDRGEEFSDREACALVQFKKARAHMFGGPNDEALHGHPLYERGLGPYGVFEIQHSSWVRRLEVMNSVHESHDPARFAVLKHFVFTFHDGTFECIAESFDASVHAGSVSQVLRASWTEP